MNIRILLGGIIILINSLVIQGQTTITGYEWWFDQSFDDAVFSSVPPTAQFELEASFETTNLTAGLHSFHIRFLDDSNRFSPILSKFFYKPAELLISDRTITACQWWLDHQFNNATTEQLPSGSLLHWNDNLDMNSMEDGLHSIHLRFQDNTGMWTPLISRFYYKFSFQQIQDRMITECRYWLDDNPEEMVVSSLPPGYSMAWTAELDLNELPAGLHIFHIQFRDNSGQWSVPLDRFFIKREDPNNTNPEIISCRYWIDDDFDTAEEILIETPAEVVDITQSVDLTQIWKGEHLLHFQIKDDHGLWSQIISDTVIKVSLPIASFDFTTAVYCDSTTVTIQNQSIDGDVYSWDFGDGMSSNEPEPVHTYTNPGDYIISLTVTDTLTGMDSTLTKSIAVISATTYETVDPVVCDSYVSPSGNYTWIVSGMYSDTLINAAGCDSIVAVDLTVLNSSFSSISVSSCDSYTSPSGLYTWSASDVYFDTLVNSVGCDSVITINLTIFETTYAMLETSTCDSYVSPSGSYTWDQTGTYFDTIANTAGCDSILTINLTVVEVDTSVTNADPVLIANATNAEYQWIDCNSMEPIPGATGQSYTATINGTFAVIVTQDGCTDTSACFAILSVEIGTNPFKEGIHVFPNPTGGSVTLDLGTELHEVMIFVRNNQGKLVVSKLFYNTSKMLLEIPGPPGQYTLEILSKEGEKAVLKVLRN